MSGQARIVTLEVEEKIRVRSRYSCSVPSEIDDPEEAEEWIARNEDKWVFQRQISESVVDSDPIYDTIRLDGDGVDKLYE